MSDLRPGDSVDVDGDRWIMLPNGHGEPDFLVLSVLSTGARRFRRLRDGEERLIVASTTFPRLAVTFRETP
jgi:hypothetical protein